MNGGWLGGGQESALLCSVSLNPLLAESSNFSGSLVFFGSVTKCMIFPDSVVTAWGLAANQSSGGEKNCIVYRFFFSYSSLLLLLSLFPFLSY